MKKLTNITFILLVSTLVSIAHGSLFQRFGFTKKIVTVGLAGGSGAVFVGYHENAWRKVRKKIVAQEKRIKQLQGNVGNFAKEHPEAAQHIPAELNDFMSNMQNASDIIGASDVLRELSAEGAKHYRFALLSRLSYGTIDNALKSSIK